MAKIQATGKLLPKISIAVLDTDIDATHPCFQESTLKFIELPGLKKPSKTQYLFHGTFVASLIFGLDENNQRRSSAEIEGFIIPIYEEDQNGLFCSQERLSEAIKVAVDAGVHIINISGGEKIPNHFSYLPLMRAVEYALSKNVLIIAAAGNDGCACLHYPAALPGVLAVGAADSDGTPLAFSNFGADYQHNGISVATSNQKGALPGGGFQEKKSTSFATAFLSLQAAELMSKYAQSCGNIQPLTVRDIILSTSTPCVATESTSCERYLAGTFDLETARKKIEELCQLQPSSQKEVAQGHSLESIIEETIDQQPLENKVDSLKISAQSTNSQRSYVNLDNETATTIVQQISQYMDSLPEQIHQKISECLALELPLTMLGKESRENENNYRLYFGFKNAARETTGDAPVGIAIGWTAGTNEVEIKHYHRLSTQEQVAPPSLTEGIGRIFHQSPEFHTIIQELFHPINWDGHFNLLEVKEVGSDRISWDLSAKSLVLDAPLLNRIGEAFELPPENVFWKWITTPIEIQNFAFGVNNKGSPFLTLYYKASNTQPSSIQPINTENKTYNSEIMENQFNTPADTPASVSPPFAEGVITPQVSFSAVIPSSVQSTAQEQNRVEPSACGCSGNKEEAQKPSQEAPASPETTPQRGAKVYAIGTLSIEFSSNAERLSFEQYSGINSANIPEVIAYLKQNPAEAEALHWVLSVGGAPVWAIRPHGHFITEAYEEMRNLLEDCASGDAERVAIPGVRYGSVKLASGQVLPALAPSTRGMASWNTDKILEALGKKDDDASGNSRVRDFLNRLYHEMRNNGTLPEHRALNYAATNAFQVGQIFQEAMSQELELGNFGVKKSPVAQPGHSTYDVEMVFFKPQDRLNHSQRVFSFTVDITSMNPFLVGDVRTWYKY